MLASTRSPASRSSSSFGPYSGDLGKAIKPVRVDSSIPKGAMSFMKESILDGLAELFFLVSRYSQTWPFDSKTYTSTMQLFVLMSKTFPPN